MRFSDTPMGEQLPESERSGIMYSELAIVAEHKLMATDSLESMGHKVTPGNNTTICLNLEANEDANRIYAALSVGSTEGAPMCQEFFGYRGSFLDRFGIRWMLVVSTPINKHQRFVANSPQLHLSHFSLPFC